MVSSFMRLLRRQVGGRVRVILESRGDDVMMVGVHVIDVNNFNFSHYIVCNLAMRTTRIVSEMCFYFCWHFYE